MKLHILAIGHKPPAWVVAGFEDYVRRMPREARIEVTEIKPAPRSGRAQSAASIFRILAVEKARFLAALPPGCVRIALDERGKQLTTAELARKLAAWMRGGSDVAFMIGSADGLDQELKANADLLLALSAMTLPHAMVRVLLAEQLYRAMSMIRNHPYHRE
ncbi:MAG: 23S rRNA (pseudouridine(1915)-N(3))-methyltransferase RlmH [Betaproteobacteria bacterium]|nr:23S rRNA (pseudouridine(1915)-N(3))-methyltransferase RlmH [Betaproteobacteria bacterium]